MSYCYKIERFICVFLAVFHLSFSALSFVYENKYTTQVSFTVQVKGHLIAALYLIMRIKKNIRMLVSTCNCNCNYILFTKLPWPGDNEGTFRFSSQAATCLPHTAGLHTVPFNAERQAAKL